VKGYPMDWMANGNWKIETKKIIMSSFSPASVKFSDCHSPLRFSAFPDSAAPLYGHQDICRLSCRHDVNCMYNPDALFLLQRDTLTLTCGGNANWYRHTHNLHNWSEREIAAHVKWEFSLLSEKHHFHTARVSVSEVLC